MLLVVWGPASAACAQRNPEPDRSSLAQGLDRPAASAELVPDAPAPRSTVAPAARADARPPTDRWSVDLSLANSIPSGVGLAVDIESPFGVTFSAGGGHTPAAYLGLVTDAVQGAGVLQPEGRRLVNELQRNGAWYASLGVGARLAEVLELRASYLFLTLSADPSVDAVREAMGGARLPPVTVDSVPSFVQIHALQARIGGRALLGERVVFRFGVGWIHRVAGRFGAQLPEQLQNDPQGRLTALYDRVGQAIARYGFTPELYLQLGVRL